MATGPRVGCAVERTRKGVRWRGAECGLRLSAHIVGFICAGAADGTVKVWDRRALGGALHTFALHSSPIMRVEWAPYRKGAHRTHAHMNVFPSHVAPFPDLEPLSSDQCHRQRRRSGSGRKWF